MKQSFTQLANLWFKHKYFSNGLFAPLSVKYSETTSKLITDLNLVVKSYEGYISIKCIDPKMLENMDIDTRLTFYIYCSDNNYINYTDLPEFEIKTHLLYFTNRNLSAEPEVREEYFLHQSELVGESEILRLCHSVVDLPPNEAGSNYIFKDIKGGTLHDICVKRTSDKTQKYNLLHLQEGPVDIYKADVFFRRIYYHTNTVWKKPVAVVELYLDQLLTYFNTNKELNLTVNFGSRQTKWKYFLVGPEFKRFTDLTIITKKKEELFHPLEDTSEEEFAHWIFESDKELNLAEHYDFTFQLVDKFNREDGSFKPVIKSLTKASADQIFLKPKKETDKEKEAADKKTLYSHIYI